MKSEDFTGGRRNSAAAASQSTEPEALPDPRPAPGQAYPGQAFTAAVEGGALAPLTAGKLIEWVSAAQPRARLIYATGPSCRASCGERVADLVGTLCAKDFVTAHFQKVAGTGRYLVQRSARRAMAGELAQLVRDAARVRR